MARKPRHTTHAIAPTPRPHLAVSSRHVPAENRAAKPRRLHGRLLRPRREQLACRDQTLRGAVIHTFGRADQLDTAALQRLVTSINRVLEAGDGVTPRPRPAWARSRSTRP